MNMAHEIPQLFLVEEDNEILGEGVRFTCGKIVVCWEDGGNPFYASYVDTNDFLTYLSKFFEGCTLIWL